MQEIFDLKLDLSSLDEFQWDADEVTIGEKTINDVSGKKDFEKEGKSTACLLYTSPSPRDRSLSRMPSSA